MVRIIDKRLKGVLHLLAVLLLIILNNMYELFVQIFTEVFGVGAATAKKWINNGWASIDDAKQFYKGNDDRVKWG